MSEYDRRKLLGLGGLAGVGVLAGCSGHEGKPATQSEGPSSPAVHTKKTKRLKMVMSWPRNFPGLGTTAEQLANTVNTLSEGSLEIKIFAAGELVPAHQEFDAVSSGAADLYHAADYYWQGKSKGFSFFAAVPFGMTSVETMAWMNYGDGNKLWQELSAEFNIIAMAAGSTGPQMGGWFKKEINTADDFRGLVMRIPGLGGDVIKAMGGVPKLLSGGAIYQALQSGAIDATEWVGPWNDLAFGFYQEAPFYYGPGFHEPGPILSLGCNLDVWNGLSEVERLAIRTAAGNANTASMAEFGWKNQIAMQTLINEHGVQMRTFSDDIWRSLSAAAKDVISDVGNSNPKVQKIYESYMQALKAARAYSKYADAGYLRVREL